jgi:hypothetical protein
VDCAYFARLDTFVFDERLDEICEVDCVDREIGEVVNMMNDPKTHGLNFSKRLTSPICK